MRNPGDKSIAGNVTKVNSHHLRRRKSAANERCKLAGFGRKSYRLKSAVDPSN